jgi:hypothetical protein
MGRDCTFSTGFHESARRLLPNERESTLVIRIHVHLPVDEILVECSGHILAAKEYSRTE